MSELLSLTIAAARDGLKNKSFSASELTEAHIAAVEKARALNAYVLETPDHARGQAKASDARIASVASDQRSVSVGVIAGAGVSPTITGWSPARPERVEVAGRDLPQVTSLRRLQAAREGWYWDYMSKLWHVKVDVGTVEAMQTKQFTLQS